MASFDDVYRTYCAWKTPNVAGPVADAAEATFRKTITEFEKEHGKLDHYSIFTSIGAGVGLTQKGGLFFVDPPELSREDIEKLILKAKSLYRTEQSTLDANDLRRCAEDIYFVINGLYAAQETATRYGDAVVTKLFDKAVIIHQEEFDQAEANWKRCAAGNVQMRYFEGTLIGLIPLFIAGFLLYRLVGFVMSSNAFKGESASKTIHLEILGALIAAGMGAIVSVMTRLSSEKLKLDYTAGSLKTRLLGGLRPLIGAVMGVVLLIFVKGGLLPLSMPDVAATPEKAAFFLLAVTFVAGFSERLVQDMLAAADTDPRFGAGNSPTPPTPTPPAPTPLFHDVVLRNVVPTPPAPTPPAPTPLFHDMVLRNVVPTPPAPTPSGLG